MKKVILALLISLFNAHAFAAAETVRPVFPTECILKLIAGQRKITLRASEPVPVIRFASETPLAEFQDAIEPQWGLRPDDVLNAYILKLNRIYLLDDVEYYRKYGRSIDDSLAHELMHYLQYHYQGYPDLSDPGAEPSAIETQTWFRETFIDKKVDPKTVCQ